MFVFKKNNNKKQFFYNYSKISSLVTFLALFANTVILPVFTFYQFTEASFTQNNSLGSWNVDFNGNQQGIAPDGAPLRSNITVDTTAGVAKITTGQSAGYFHTTAIAPNSFTSWDKITIDATYSNSSDVQVSLTDCTVPTPNPLVGFQNMTPGPGGVINVASLSSSYTCVKIRVDLNDSGGPRPVVNDVKMTWIPLPVFLVSHTSQSTRSVGDTLVYAINYSVSYVTDPGVVVWAELPSVANGTVTNYTASYGILPNPTFISATNSGAYTATGTTVNGITVPANSVYWNLGSVPAGRTGTLSYQLQTQNGWENGIKYSSQAHIDSALGTLVHSDSNTALAGNQPFVTTLVGAPTPSIDKQVFGAVRIGTENFVVSSGSYTPLITYQVKVTNVRGTNGIETIWNPVITDNLSDIYTKMSSVCGIAAPTSRVTVNDGGAKVGNTLVWDTPTGDLTHMGPGAEKTVSYTIDYTGCPDDTIRTYTNLVSFDGDNINPITDQEVVKMGVTAAGGGTFSKGAPTDQYHNDSYDYTLNVSNSGTVALGDIVMADKMDTTLDLISVDVPSTAGATVYYNTTGSANPVNTPPAYTITPGVGISGAGWTTTQPSVGSTVWTAVYIPCIQSTFFNATPANTLCYQKPTAVTATLNVRLKPPAAACSAYTVPNTGVFSASRAAPTIANDTLSSITPITGTDARVTNISPRLGALGVRSEIIGPNIVNVAENTTFTIHIENTGVDTAQNVQVVVPLPKLNINGVNNVPIDFVNATGATIVPGGLPNQVTLSVGNLPAGLSRDILLTVNAPKGIQNLDTFTLNATVTGTDDNNCRPINAVLSKSVTVVSEPNLSVFKSRKEAVIPSGGDIHYTMQWSHAGTAPTTQSYVVDFIPTNAVFKNAYTTGTDATGTTFTCTGCKVYFSDSLPSLPPGASPFNTISHADIVSSFSLGTQVSPGVWTSPFGTGTHWVAWLLDDPTKTPNMVTTGRTGTVGLTVTNDDNGTASGSAGSPAGTVITNESAVFSNELLQAIGNQVSTTILPSPGLSMTKSADRSVIGAGETFNWNINYYNDGSGNDDAVTLADTITLNGSTITKVFHQWNAQAVAAGAPAGLIDITANPNLTLVDNFDGTTTITWNATTYKGSALAPLEGGLFRVEVAAANDFTTGTIIPNTVVGTYQSGANPPESISTTATVMVENPDLWLRKIVDKTDPLPGQTLNYTLTISNESAHIAPGVIITDTLPLGICYTTGSAAILSPSGYSIPAPIITGDCITTPQTLTWNNTLVSPSGTGIIPGNSPDIFITYRATVSGTVASGTTLTNGANITTTLIEDTVYPNSSSQSVTTPNPDPYLSKTAPTTVNPGAALQYTITYGNTSNQSATNAYIIDTLPDYDNDGTVDVTFSNVSGTNGESFYYHAGPVAGTPPTFDPAAPLINGWTATPVAPVAYIAIRKPTLAGLAGPFTVKVNVVMNDPDTGLPVLTGLTFTNRAEIFLPIGSTDAVLTNNIGTAVTKTPGFDLAITKVGSREGSFPGLTPGASNTYTITYTNSGTVPVCDVHITDTLDPMMSFASTAHNFSTITLRDSLGNIINPLDLTNNPILTPIATTTTISGNTITIDLGNSTLPASQVCIPAGATGSFEVYASVQSTALDSTVVTNQASIATSGAGLETETTNNTAASSVRVYRADLVTSKTGTTQTGDTTNANPGDTITYTIEYDNIGNTDASDAVISDIIPSEVCYIAGSLTAPSGSALQFSNDRGATWTYIPIAGASGDCNVTNVRVVFGGPIPAPAHYDSEGSLADFVNAGETNLQEKTISGGGEVLTLGAAPLAVMSTVGVSTNRGLNPVAEDFNKDGKLDFATAGRDGVAGQVFIGNGSGGFTASNLPGNTSGGWITSSDFNNDGNVDLARGGYGQPGQVFIGNGSGGFTASNLPGSNNSGYGIVAGDFNNDGKIDLMTAGVSGTSGQIFFGNGSGGFTNGTLIPGFTNGGYGIVAGDFNNDGNLDALTGNYLGTGRVLLGNGVGGFVVNTISGGSTVLTNGDTGDLDNDGDLDAFFGSGAGAQLYTNNSIGNFTTNIVAGTGYSYDAKIIDYDNDGDLDVITAGGYLLLNDGTGVLSTPITIASGIAGSASGIDTGDFNNDGRIDAVIAGYNFAERLLINHFGEYVTSGSYTTNITATDPVTAWNKLLVNQTVPTGTSLTYTILPASCTGTPLIAAQAAPQGFIDISSIPATTTSMCLRVNFATTDIKKTPTLDAWRATHTSSITPKFTYQAKVKTTPQLGLIPNAVSITTSTPEMETGNNDAIKEHNLIQADIAVTKTVDKTAALGTDSLTYTLSYSNNGPQPATAFRVTDTLSSLTGTPTAIVANPTSLGQTFVCTYTAGVITCDDDGNPATVSTRTLAVNETGTITITVPINTAGVIAGDIISNTATVTTGTYQITVDNDTATVNTVIGTYANTWIEKTGPTRANVDRDIVYTITYGNNGNGVADNVTITDTFDPNVTVVSANATDPAMGSCTNTLTTITCGGAGYTLPVGASYTLTVTLHVNNDLNLLTTNEIINNSVAITTTSTEASLADNSSVYDIPVYPFGLSTISGSVFIDTNGNISKELTELPLTGVTVTLTGTDIYGALVTVSTTTDAAGNYTFSGLKPGTYTVSETQPAGYDSTGASAGTALPTGNGTVSGPNMISGITVGEAQNSTNNNFGEVAGSIGNQVFYDTNSNGIFETGTDLPLAGVRILLVRDSNGNGVQDVGEPVQVAYTDTTGNYHFDNLALTQYIVKVSDTAGILAAYTAIGGPSIGGADDESKDPAGYRITLSPATPVQTLADFGYNAIAIPAGTPGSIGTKIFADFDANGQLDGADVGISGVSVDLYRDNDASGTYTFGDTFLGRVFTDANGDYLFGALPLDRRYVVRVSDTLGNLSGYVNTLGTPHVDNNGQNPLAYPVYLQTGVMESVITADFSYQPPYPDLKITKTHTGLNIQGGTATYNLVVQNKITASGNATAPIRVTDTLVADLSYSTATGTDWDCSATVAPLVDCTYVGTYPVTPGTTLPTLTITAIISATAVPPLTNTATVSTPLELPHVLADNTATDPVTYVSASADGVIGTTVWADEDGDGERDVAEPGIENVTINLYSDLDGDGLPDDRDADLLFDPVLDRIATTMTDSNGEYLFTGLDRDDLVNGYYDYLVSVDTSTIPAGYTHTTGTPATDNFSQIETNYTIRLSNVEPTNVTADFGYRPVSPDLTITKTHTQPIIHQGDIVEFTLTVNNMAGFGDVPNTNEIIVTDIMPAGMILVPSATVAATNALGAGWNCTTSTPTQLRCISTTGLAAGSTAQNIVAVIEVNPVSVPTSITNTASVTTVREESINTLNNTGSDTFDVVLSNTGTIGSTVWDDQNGNGFRDGSEPGIGGVRVYLYQDVNEDGLLDSGDILIDTQITSTTGTIGEYSFVNLERDLGLGYYPYIVHVEDTDVTAIDSQYVLTIGTAGSDNFSQVQDYLVTLNSTNLSNLTADFGFKLPPNLTLTKTISGSSTAHIGESMTFLLEVTNIGGGTTDGTDIVITDTLPSNLTFSVAGSSPECSAVGQVVTCTLTGIPAVLAPLTGNHSFTIVSTANTVGPVENTATVSGGGITTPVDSAPSIGVVNPTTWSIAKSGTPLTGTPGTPATFTITITNSGAGNTQGTYTVTDTLPAGLVFTTTGSDSRCSAVAQVVTCTDTTVLAPTASTSFDIAVAIANAGSYDNTATVSGGAATTATSNTVTVVRTAPASGGGGGGCAPGSSWNGAACTVPSVPVNPTTTTPKPPVVTPTTLRKSTLKTLWKTETPTFGMCEYPVLTTPIKFGTQNDSDDVKFLEQFLNTYENEQLVINGMYEKGDFDAVVRFQEKYTDTVLRPWNLTKGTGYVYKTSLAQIARQYTTACTTTKTTPETISIPSSGTHIRIPAINLDRTIYTTGTLKQAKDNVWHSPETEMPQEGGNTVLVGHRYVNLIKNPKTGKVERVSPQPGVFFDLPNIPVGADIYITQGGKEYQYRTTENFVANPTDTWIEDETATPTLTLYTCTPLYTSKQRQVVRAELVK